MSIHSTIKHYRQKLTTVNTILAVKVIKVRIAAVTIIVLKKRVRYLEIAIPAGKKVTGSERV